jgi:hypothetical protein
VFIFTIRLKVTGKEGGQLGGTGQVRGKRELGGTGNPGNASDGRSS